MKYFATAITTRFFTSRRHASSLNHSTMESQHESVIREMVEAVSQEMEFYREIKRRRQAISIWEPKTELTRQQAIAFENSNCDLFLKQAAKAILEEIQYNRNQRRIGRYFLYGLFGIIFIAASITAGFIIWEMNKPPKRKYGLKH
ncbi:uncharacterized protein LOC131668226 [Phymastichus coffea]|uniref:uncharacterized protein LOC131668226 n=1 Tax=Phymastichus coffea TaxID=108790 RepID=UPI00273B1793|nr:uncharacterized protein LOC131668226 [Phymastichus coffea]